MSQQRRIHILEDSDDDYSVAKEMLAPTYELTTKHQPQVSGLGLLGITEDRSNAKVTI